MVFISQGCQELRLKKNLHYNLTFSNPGLRAVFSNAASPMAQISPLKLQIFFLSLLTSHLPCIHGAERVCGGAINTYNSRVISNHSKDSILEAK
jgi:hypothetical protein